ncbi:hypothetical protein GT348_09020 (plasmid) [Aristophania vespae]|uniref:Glycosyltransferase family 2 protein n=1 Tax=Aristophania vespae TaxID=2697033 RepID=A0A6P1NGD2_9PROT|nr:hypothetical protein [Aristophania vespae]QHI96488.1 hypothetical protein GT348_09020 [Aristophania vespae]UMM64825.1 hypothetical protein DM15PD_18450 [Aristophania vespae]
MVEITNPTSGKILLATPCYGGMVTTEYMLSVIGYASAGQSVPMTIMHIGDDAMITRARNTLISNFFFKSDCTHILFVDADIGFHANAPTRLFQAGKDVIAGMYPLRDRFWDKQTKDNILHGESQQTASLRYVGETSEIHNMVGQGPLLKSPYAGTGFMMISRKAIAAMIRAYPETEYRRIDAPDDGSGIKHFALFDGSIDPETGTYLSEDYTFCKRWRDIGGEIWLDTSLELTHNGRASFAGKPSTRVGISFNGNKL